MSQITTYILDTTRGQPAADVVVALLGQDGSDWPKLARGITDADGCLTDLLPPATVLAPGVYKLKFFILEYFTKHGRAHFYPLVEIYFAVADEAHYHVPLLLNLFGYSTYCGS